MAFRGRIRFTTLLVLAGILLSACRVGNERASPPLPAVPDLPSTAPSNGIGAPTPALPEAAWVPAALQFDPGRNDYVLDIDGTPRAFIVYVPSGYDTSAPTPLVVMFHGTNQTGKVMYENTSWVQLAERETVVVAFPTAWTYPLVGEPGVHEKWNVPTLDDLAQPGTEFKDDLKFVRRMVETLQTSFNLDDKRLFASGFSNGGSFVVTRLIPEMSDVFPAFATAGTGLLGGATPEEMPTVPGASLYSAMGTQDQKLSDGTELPLPFPFTESELLGDANFTGMLQKTTALLGLDMNYAVESTASFTRLDFTHSTAGGNNEYVFLMIDGMGHIYPNGVNNRYDLDVAPLFWEFFLKHPKP